MMTFKTLLNKTIVLHPPKAPPVLLSLRAPLRPLRFVILCGLYATDTHPTLSRASRERAEESAVCGVGGVQRFRVETSVRTLFPRAEWRWFVV